MKWFFFSENLSKLPSMLEPPPKIYIVGDLHGQFTDLLRIFERCGSPKSTVSLFSMFNFLITLSFQKYLFLGDYVDRGPNSLETICLLLLLRIKYPSNVYMLRGNHECSTINRVYGFYDECEDRFQCAPMDDIVWGVTAMDLKGTMVWYRFQVSVSLIPNL